MNFKRGFSNTRKLVGTDFKMFGLEKNPVLDSECVWSFGILLIFSMNPNHDFQKKHNLSIQLQRKSISFDCICFDCIYIYICMCMCMYIYLYLV